jgi:hypothetical protein
MVIIKNGDWHAIFNNHVDKIGYIGTWCKKIGLKFEATKDGFFPHLPGEGC